MTYRDVRDAAERLRELPLEDVLVQLGAERDRRDRAKWRIREGLLSVTGGASWTGGSAGAAAGRSIW